MFVFLYNVFGQEDVRGLIVYDDKWWKVIM